VTVTLLLVDEYARAVARWHVRFAQEVPHVDVRESLAVLALRAAIPANRLAASALPSSWTGDDPANGSPRLLSAGCGERRKSGRGSEGERGSLMAPPLY
jgi:hypothetical protein